MNKNILKRIISAITIIIFITTSAYAGGSVTPSSAWTGGIASSFAGGYGTSSEPYLISTPEQLAYLATLVNNNNSNYNSEYYKLTTDIDLGGREWTPIGKGVLATDLTSNSNYAFKGVFNGNGHTVSNFKITTANTSYLGLFGNLYGGSSVSVANLNVSDFTINATLTSTYNLAAGGIAGASYAIISSCSASNGTVNIKTTASSNANCYAGGLVGRNQGGGITKSYAAVSVATTTSGTSCHSYAGGLAGHITTGNVKYSYSTSNVSSTSEGATSAAYAGGFTAANNGSITSAYSNGTAYAISKKSTAMSAGFAALNTAEITTSYATGEVTTVSSTKTGYGGGLVANNAIDESNVGTITSCFATGNVTVSGMSNAYAGGLAGLSKGTITKSYRASGQTITGTTTGSYGTAIATTNLTKSSFFTSSSYFTPTWDFTEEWTLGVSGSYQYPTLISVPHPANWAGDMATSFSGGNGSIASPYEIATAGELALLASNVNGGNSYQGTYFKLTANIDLGGLEWIPIGKGTITVGGATSSKAFSGSFDGCNYTISNFIINNATTAYTGLFGIVYNGSISNLKVTDFIINVATPDGSISNIGGIAGTNTGSITSCYASGSVSGSGSQVDASVGGIVGRNESGIISECVSEVQITATTTTDACHAFAGGIAGYNNVGTITTSYSTGDITAHSSGTQSAAYVGGITAISLPDSVIMDCYSNSNVNATSGSSTAIAGGFVGHNYGEITTCYSTGNVICNSVTKSGYGGGFAGNTAGTIKSCFTVSNVTLTATLNKNSGNFAGAASDTATFTNCYYTSSQSVSPAPSNTYGSATSSSNLTKSAFYTSTSNFATVWNMTNIWTMGQVSGYNYPTLICTMADDEPDVPVDDDPNIDPDGWDGKPAESFAGGKGTEADPYQIATPGQLLLLSNEVNDGNSDYYDKNYILTDNINLNYRSWTPIGKGSQSGAIVDASDAFFGIFDGNGYIIENLKINRAPNGFAGLFGSVNGKYGGELKNIILNNVTVDLTYSSANYLRIGAIAGHTTAAIKDCYTGGNMSITNNGSFSHIYAGGIVGYASGNCEISGCSSEINITATSTVYNSRAGGVVGFVEDASILKCSSAGNIKATGKDFAYAGGIAAYTEPDNNIMNCYSKGDISAKVTEQLAFAGGLAGYNNTNWYTSYAAGTIESSSQDGESYAGGLFGSSTGVLTSCFAVNDVYAQSTSGTGYAGGLMGKYGGGALNNCYRSTEQDIDGDSIVSRGQTATLTNLKSEEFLTNTAYFIAPWDFEAVWQFKPATGYAYPVHRSSVTAGGVSLDVWEGEVATSFDSGSGTSARPYKIATASQLAYLAYMVNTGTDYDGSYFVLTADIDLSESPWVPIGKSVNISNAVPVADKAFSGSFDGKGYTVKNMTISGTEKSCYGLFGCVYNGSIENVNVDNYKITITPPTATNVFAGGIAGIISGNITSCTSNGSIEILDAKKAVYSGGITGINYTGVISSSRAIGSVKTSTTGNNGLYSGGIAGVNHEGIIEVSYSGVAVTAANSGNDGDCFAGGITGLAVTGEVLDCYNNGEVKASSTGSISPIAGGIAGGAKDGSQISVGYSTGDVSSSSYIADSYAGGIVGSIEGSTIESLLSIGNVTADIGGGIIGKSSSSTITKCYKNNQQTVTAGTVTTTGPSLSADNFKDQAFLTDTRYFTTLWDFDEIWTMDKAEEYEYPTLQAISHISSGSSEETPGDETGSFVISYDSGLIIINAETAISNAVVIIAGYSGNKMTNTEILPENILQGENYIITNTFTEADADKIKIMLWDSANTQSQLCSAKEITL